jgi:hypothetical protein
MRALAWLICAVAFGCSASSKQTFGDVTASGATTSGGGGEGGTGNATSSSAMGAGGFNPQSGSGGGGLGPPMTAEVYGHSADVLYRLDPVTKKVTVVGPFQGCSSVIDLAIDGDSKVFATTFGGLFRIEKTNAKCTPIAQGGYPNSLSFVPKGTLFADKEALVGYQGSTYVQIDTTTGVVKQIGSIGSGLSSSGDIVSVKDGGTYLTVNGSGCSDCIIEVDPKTGKMTKNWGPIGYSAVFGIAFWAGSVYGFTNGGDLFEIQFKNGLKTTKIPVPMAPPGLSFWGAGSTTSAPVNNPT